MHYGFQMNCKVSFMLVIVDQVYIRCRTFLESVKTEELHFQNVPGNTHSYQPYKIPSNHKAEQIQDQEQ